MRIRPPIYHPTTDFLCKKVVIIVMSSKSNMAHKIVYWQRVVMTSRTDGSIEITRLGIINK